MSYHILVILKGQGERGTLNKKNNKQKLFTQINLIEWT